MPGLPIYKFVLMNNVKQVFIKGYGNYIEVYLLKVVVLFRAKNLLKILLNS